MGRSLRVRRSAAEWSGLVSQWRSSGETARAFCERQGLKPSTFSWWQGELGRRELEEPRRETPQKSLPVGEVAPASTFARVRVRQASTSPASRLEVVSGSGHIVRVQGAVDAVSLRALLEALEAC
jgi:hypothetical protein